MSNPVRDTQLSMVEGMERPVGRIPLSVQTGTNADLIATIAPIYLTGSVLDVTYGRGKWWDRFTPEPFTFHDLNTVDGVDFRNLPHDADSFDAVCFDPPYVASGGTGTTESARKFQEGFGIGHDRLSGKDLERVCLDGLSDVCRVASRFVLVKCMEYAGGGSEFKDMPTVMTVAATSHGWVTHDRIVHHTGTGPGGHNITKIKRARRAHSYLIVFTKSKTSEAALPSLPSGTPGDYSPSPGDVLDGGGSQEHRPASVVAPSDPAAHPAIDTRSAIPTEENS